MLFSRRDAEALRKALLKLFIQHSLVKTPWFLFCHSLRPCVSARDHSSTLLPAEALRTSFFEAIDTPRIMRLVSKPTKSKAQSSFSVILCAPAPLRDIFLQFFSCKASTSSKSWQMLFSRRDAEALRTSFFEAIDTPRDPGFHQGFAKIEQIPELAPCQSQICLDLLLVCRTYVLNGLQF
jgi:hypothetical protein